MSRPTVAVYVRRYLPYSQTFIHEEVRHHERYSVEVFAHERLNGDRFPFEPVHAPSGRLGRIAAKNYLPVPRFEQRFREKRYRLVHAHFGYAAVYAQAYAERHRLPFVVTLLGNDVGTLLHPRRYAPANWAYTQRMEKVLKRANLLLTVSEELRSFVIELGADPKRVVTHRHGVDIESFRPRSKPSRARPEIVMVGRLAEKKGHRYAIAALRDVAASGQDFHLTLIGDGPLRAELEHYAADHLPPSSVTFAGALAYEEVAEQVSLADLALIPSVVARDGDREGSPTVAMEAAAAGVPVVATWHAGLSDMVQHGETGLLVPERNAPALTRALLTLLQEEAQRAEMGQAARAHAEAHFDVRERVRILEDLYDSVS